MSRSHPHGVSGVQFSVIESIKYQRAFHVLIPPQILLYVLPEIESQIVTWQQF